MPPILTFICEQIVNLSNVILTFMYNQFVKFTNLAYETYCTNYHCIQKYVSICIFLHIETYSRLIVFLIFHRESTKHHHYYYRLGQQGSALAMSHHHFSLHTVALPKPTFPHHLVRHQMQPIIGRPSPRNNLPAT